MRLLASQREALLRGLQEQSKQVILAARRSGIVALEIERNPSGAVALDFTLQTSPKWLKRWEITSLACLFPKFK